MMDNTYLNIFRLICKGIHRRSTTYVHSYVEWSCKTHDLESASIGYILEPISWMLEHDGLEPIFW